MARKAALVSILGMLALASIGTTPASPPERTTIVDIAGGDPDFSILVAAVMKADLLEVLDGRRQFTVFAPTNAAFDAAAVDILGMGNDGLDLVDTLSRMELTQVLLYHVSPGRRFSDDILDMDQVRMLNKGFTYPSLSNSDVFINDALVIMPDIDADNGVVHVIDKVLLP